MRSRFNPSKPLEVTEVVSCPQQVHIRDCISLTNQGPSSMDQEHEPFLHVKDETQEKSNSSSPSTTLPKSLARLKEWRSSFLVHTVLILLYTIVSIATIRASRDGTLLRPPRKQHMDTLPVIPTYSKSQKSLIIQRAQPPSTISSSHTHAPSSTTSATAHTLARRPRPSTPHGPLCSHPCIFAYRKQSCGAITRSLLR